MTRKRIDTNYPSFWHIYSLKGKLSVSLLLRKERASNQTICIDAQGNDKKQWPLVALKDIPTGLGLQHWSGSVLRCCPERLLHLHLWGFQKLTGQGPEQSALTWKLYQLWGEDLICSRASLQPQFLYEFSKKAYSYINVRNIIVCW